MDFVRRDGDQVRPVRNGHPAETLDRVAQHQGAGLTGSVVVSGSLPAADGSHSLYCAVIVKQVDEKTRSKTSVNELLRGAAE